MGIAIEDTAETMFAAKTIAKESILELSRPAGPHRNKVVQEYFYGLRVLPEDVKLHNAEGIVLYNLAQCFVLAGNVEESPIENVMHGFKISGIDPHIVMDGFIELCRLGYVTFADVYGTALLGTVNEKAWFKLTHRFFNIFAKTKEEALKDTKEMGREKNTAKNFIDKLSLSVHDDKKLDNIEVPKV